MAHELTLSKIHEHHSHLLHEIQSRYDRLMSAARIEGPLDGERDSYVEFLEGELIPHALSEEETIYMDASQESDLSSLVAGMTDEHQRILSLINQLKAASGSVDIIASASGFFTMLVAHFDKENRLLLPALNSRGILPD